MGLRGGPLGSGSNPRPAPAWGGGILLFFLRQPPFGNHTEGPGSDNNSPPFSASYVESSHFVKIKFAQQEARKWDLAFLKQAERIHWRIQTI